ncbi:coiled-coil domain-containing protein 201 [Meles meles]|uniref:coiled-coil domain-containing protein 201 n=1 Tax=Meles meles TaxID=9662 RepID=UPI001E69A332|nr:coiled-coil domain-containing protein 201 [Meles meles]
MPVRVPAGLPTRTSAPLGPCRGSGAHPVKAGKQSPSREGFGSRTAVSHSQLRTSGHGDTKTLEHDPCLECEGRVTVSTPSACSEEAGEPLGTQACTWIAEVWASTGPREGRKHKQVRVGTRQVETLGARPAHAPPCVCAARRATGAGCEQHQRAESHREGSWPRSWGLPGIPNMAGRRRRDLKKLEAVAERVRQWEIRLLQDIEEATQHELTVEDDCPSVLGPGAEGLWSACLGLTDSSGPPSVRPSANPSPPQGLLRSHLVPCPPGDALLDTGVGQLARLWATPPERGAHREQEPAGNVDAYPRGAHHPTSFPSATQGTG